MLVGREAEQTVLSRLLADASTQRGQALLLRGEAGIGKTALLEHACVEATSGGFLVLRCSGVESEVELGFSGLHQLLLPVLDRLAVLPDVQAAALRGALGLQDATATDLQVAAGCLTLLSELAGAQPLLIAIDDLQWLDRATAATLVFVARRLGAHPIAVALTARDFEAAPVETGDLSELRLEGLPVEAATSLLADSGWELPRHMRESVLAATGGNPLALTELAASDDQEQLLAEITMSNSAPVGDRLRTAFLRRASELPPESRGLLLIAAAEETGSTATVLRTAERQGLSATAVGPAERQNLVLLHGDRLRFQHPLVRSVLYAEATFDQRRVAHQALADQLAADGELDRAAWHRAVVATGPNEQLAADLERGADTARRRGGEAAVASVLQRAARLSESAERCRDRLMAAGGIALDSGQPELARNLAEEALAGPVPEASMLQLLGNIELYSGDPHVAHAQLLRCAHLLRAADPEESAWVLMKAASAAYHAGDFEATLDAADRIAGLDCSTATRMAGRWMASRSDIDGQALWQLAGELARSHPRAGGRTWLWVTVIAFAGSKPYQARRLARETGRQLHAHGTAAHLAELHYYQGMIEYQLGQWDEGIAHAEEGLRFARGMGQRPLTADNLALLALFAAGRGEVEECRRFADEALEIAVPLRVRLAAGIATGALGVLALGEGDPQDAWARLSRLLQQGSSYAHGQMILELVTELVEAAVRADEPETVRTLVTTLEGSEATASTPDGRARLEHCHALLASDAEGADGEAECEAEQRFERAIAAQDQPARLFQHARARLHYGEWLRRRRRAVEARGQLQTALEAFEGFGARRWAERARAELRAAGGSAHRAGSSAGSWAVANLSGQEWEVARLASRGLSNREIGERLVLSPRTVGSHLYRLFPKLGVTSRSHLRDLDFG